MPPKVGPSDSTISINLSGSEQSTSISKTSIPAKRLKRTALPSITGFDANAPILPSPNTADPLVTTPTKLARPVNSAARLGSRAISKHGAATPGVYARERSRWVTHGLLGMTSIFPDGERRWYSRARRSCCSLDSDILNLSELSDDGSGSWERSYIFFKSFCTLRRTRLP